MGKKRRPIKYGRSPTTKEIDAFVTRICGICKVDELPDPHSCRTELRQYLNKRVAKMWDHADDAVEADPSSYDPILSLEVD